MSGGPIYGEGFLDLKPALSPGFAGSLGSMLGPILGPKLTAAIKSPVALGIAAGIGAGLAAVNLGGEFDKAFDAIRVGTGATGEALAGLKDDFRAVFGSVPVAMGPAADAVADLNTRLGLTGQPLQDLATQFLNLSRITGTDLKGNVADLTRVFGDWGIATEDQAGTLDALFRASQATGAGVDAIATSIVQYGAPLRQLGFGFEQSAALLGKFEKEGVNAELVLGSLRIALGKMARDGEPAEETFKRVTEEIANAGSASEANALALELFGARAGPDMAAAIREGRFELGALFDQVTNGTETINGAAADTDDWRESMTLLGNNLKLVFEPIATAVFKGLGEVMGWIVGVIETVRAAMGDPSSGLGQAITIIGDIFGQVAGIIGDYIGYLTAIWNRWGDDITRVVTTVFGTLAGIIRPILNTIRAVIKTVTDLISGDWSGVWNGIKAVLAGVWDTLAAIVQVPIDTIKLAITTALDVIEGAWNTIWGGLKGAVTKALEAVVAVVKYPINALLGLLEGLINGALTGLQKAIDAADVLAGPFINFPDAVFGYVSLPRVHAGGLIGADEAVRILQRGELVVPSDTTRRLFDALDQFAADADPAGGRSLFDGATFNLQGTPATLAADVARRVGLEVRLAT